MKKIQFLTYFLFIIIQSYAQIGIGTNTPHASAALELSSTSKGLLLPRMTTAQRNIVSSPSVGLTLYNTTTNTIEYYTGQEWISLSGTSPTSKGSATITAMSATGSTGELKLYQDWSSVTQSISVTVAVAGTYYLRADAGNITFFAEGTFPSAGIHTVVLKAKPRLEVGLSVWAPGDYLFKIDSSIPCTFNRTLLGIYSNGTADINNMVCGSSAGTLYRGEPASGVTQSITFDVDKAGTVSITATAAGVTFSYNGTLAVGTHTVNMTASGTPLSSGEFSFPVSPVSVYTEENCSFVRQVISRTTNGTAHLNYLYCTTDRSGQMIAGTAITESGTNSVWLLISVYPESQGGTYSFSTDQVNGVKFTASGTFPNPAAYEYFITLKGEGTPVAAGSFTYTLNSSIGSPSICTYTFPVHSTTTNGTAIASSWNCNVGQTGEFIVNAPLYDATTQVISGNFTQAGTYNITTTTSNGITFSGSGTVAVGNQNIILTASGVPLAAGTFTYTLNTSNSCSFTRRTFVASSGGAAKCDANTRTIVNPVTMPNGSVWMDRNLGASRAATAVNDVESFGCLYQWGRGHDGHGSVTWTITSGGVISQTGSATSSAQVTSSTPGPTFIKFAGSWYAASQNTNFLNLWSATSANNPCPSGYKVPTRAEFQNALGGLGLTSNTSAYTMALKFPSAGYRNRDDAFFAFAGQRIYQWTSDNGPVSGGDSQKAYHSRYMATEANISGTGTAFSSRAYGMSVRCIKITP